ncbi:MAG: hypothetical protein COA42_05295 [Alteromonadaceae bacterium]|nr:MAG: hypothetical protein COA42_05295 [Alteromonadaceae bacterium]
MTKKTATRKTTAKRRGASKSPNAEPPKNIPVIRAFLFAGVIALVVFGALNIKWQGAIDRVNALAHRPVSQVLIEGEFNFVEREGLQETLETHLSGDFMDINLTEIKKLLEANPWVASVRIQRVWPDSLKLSVIEHRPIARWGDVGFINSHGQLVYVNIEQRLVHLPLLSGNAENSDAIAQKYLQISEVLASIGLRVHGLAVDEKMFVTVTADKNLKIYLGQEKIETKLETLILVYERELQYKVDTIHYIDMRYEKGLAVGWLDGQEKRI